MLLTLTEVQAEINGRQQNSVFYKCPLQTVLVSPVAINEFIVTEERRNKDSKNFECSQRQVCVSHSVPKQLIVTGQN